MDREHKRITWVGSFFQKLEDMCQEVDDIVSQDAINFVENQLQNMGGSVKKFCSNVVEDVLPPLVNPIKREAQAVVLKSNAAISTYLQSMMANEKKHGEAATEESTTEVLELENAEEPFDASLSGFQSPQERGTITDSFTDVSESVSDASSIIPSKLPFSVVSGEEIIADMRLVCPGSSLLVEPCNNTGDCICHSSNELHSSTPTPIISIEEDTSSSKKILSLTESSGNRHIQGHSYDMNNDFNDLGMKTIELRGEVSLDTSCVVVEPSELHSLSRRIRKLRSFMKMIKDAFASKKRVAEEYEMLVFWHEEADMGSSKNRSESINANAMDMNNLEVKEESDSDWEHL